MDSILSEDRLCFAEEQFASAELAPLKSLATSLGATVVSSPDPTTILITQPYSPSYSDPFGPTAPYHWIGACASERARLSPQELDDPIFITKQSTDQPEEGSRPIRFWVSLNVKRDRAEPAEVAQAMMQAKLRRHGGIIVTKRSQADILIVNRETDFFRIIKKEIAEKGRDWQTLAEKDWVDACIQQGELLTTTDVDLGLKRPRSPSVESFSRDDDVGRIARGPGRPTGTPRNEYTPHDDDFLCRFLAAYYPHGSHGSRKTYQDLVSRQDTEPFKTASNHTAQSWHERFKKNKVPFSRRVWRFQDQGIGLDLKTDVEREREEETRRRLEEQRQQRQVASTSQQASPKTARRAFVELGEDDDDAAPEVKRPKVSSPAAPQTMSLGRGRAAALGVPTARRSGGPPGSSRSGPKSATPETARKLVQPERQHTGPSTTAIQAAVSPVTEELSRPPERVAADEARHSSLVSSSSEAVSRDEISVTVNQASTAAVVTESTAQAASERENSTERSPTKQALDVGVQVERDELESSNSDQQSSSPQPQPPAATTRSPAGAGVRQYTPGERVTASVPQPPDSARHTPRTAATSRSRSPAIVPSSPASIAHKVAATLSSSSHRSEVRQRPRPSGSPQAAHTPSRERVLQATHTPNTRSPLGISASARRSTPTTASRPVHDSMPAAVSTPANASNGNGSPALTPSQQVARGAALVTAARDTFKRNIAAYSKKYGCAPTELYTIVNRLGGKGAGRGGQMYWDDVERGLRDKFGY